MMEIVEILHFITISMVTAASSVAVGIGEGFVGLSAIRAINIQPEAKDEIQKTAVLGMALVETAAILCVTISFIILFGTQDADKNLYFALSELGIAIGLSLSGFAIGLVSAMPARSACLAIARQPFFGNKIIRFMLIAQAMIQTPVIFSFIIAIFIKSYAVSATTIAESLKLIASGLAIGLGSIGPAIGLGIFGKTACNSIGINRKSYGKIFTFTLISEGIIETPIIFAFLVSFLIILYQASTLLIAIAMLSAAFCVGLGTFGPGIGLGKIAAAACHQIAKDPEKYSMLSKVSILAQSIASTAAIYALIVAMLLITFTK